MSKLFEQWLRERRKALRLTQAQLAERAGLSTSAMEKLEGGQRRPSEQVAEVLADALQIAPKERRRFLSVASGEAGSHQGPAAPPSNLPAQLTSLIGRDHALEEIAVLLKGEGLASGLRLLTLTGPPGIGKTRLALQAASKLFPNFEDGVFFVTLAPVNDHTLVVRAIASALDLRDKGNEPISLTLKEHLREQKVLLVLDNFEHVVAAAPSVVELMWGCPHVKMLVTSREALHVRGEHRYEVPALENDASGRLFIERAQQVGADFPLTKENKALIVALCERLDGIPLAIELVAARARMLPPGALLARLENRDRRLRLGIATGGPRDLPDRHKTLRNAVAWSYDLLSREDRQLFRCLGVFAGSSSLSAIGAMLESTYDHNKPFAMDVLDAVQSLLDKSLLSQREGLDGEARFSMLEMVHEYAREKLEEAGEKRALEREHALCFMRLAEEVEPYLTGAKAVQWLGRLEDEHDNLLSALRWTLECDWGQGEHRDQERVEVGLRMAGALYRFWSVRGYFSEGREWLERMLYTNGSPGSPGSPGPVEIGWLLEGREVQEQQKIRAYAAKAITASGNLAFEQGDYSTATARFEEALTIRRELGDLWSITYLLNNLGNVSREQGELSIARSLYEESLALRRELGDRYGIAGSLNNLGLVVLEQGDYASARLMLEGSVAQFREIGDKGAIAFSLGNLGLVLLEQGDYASARSLYEESLALRRDLGHKRGIALSLAGLAEVAVAVGVAETDRGAVERGARVLKAAEAQLQSMGIVLDREDRAPFERAVVSACAQLGEDEFEKLWREGAAMSIDEAIEFALNPAEC